MTNREKVLNMIVALGNSWIDATEKDGKQYRHCMFCDAWVTGNDYSKIKHKENCGYSATIDFNLDCIKN